jgi:sec-independent protein translocase protein TatC
MTASHEPEPLQEGTLISHLIELRTRLVRALFAVLVLFVPCAIYDDELFTLIATPLLQKLPQGAQMISTSLIAPFMAPLKLAILAALFLGMPFVLYQAWAFVSPGLYRHEKRFAIPLLLSSIFLFYAGAAFAYFIVFPLMFAFLASAAPLGVTMMTDMTSYLDFVILLFFAFGAAFEIPVATVLLVWTGLVRVETMQKNRGYVLIGIFVIAAFLTPPDAVSQCFMAVPMYLLYEAGIVMARLLLKDKLAARQVEEEHSA